MSVGKILNGTTLKSGSGDGKGKPFIYATLYLSPKPLTYKTEPTIESPVIFFVASPTSPEPFCSIIVAVCTFETLVSFFTSSIALTSEPPSPTPLTIISIP